GEGGSLRAQRAKRRERGIDLSGNRPLTRSILVSLGSTTLSRKGRGEARVVPRIKISDGRSQLRLVHRPEHFGDRSLRWEHGDELALDPLQQHRIAVVVLALLVEFDVLPRHDRLVAWNVGGGE